jgi:hypothetical protein
VGGGSPDYVSPKYAIRGLTRSAPKHYAARAQSQGVSEAAEPRIQMSRVGLDTVVAAAVALPRSDEASYHRCTPRGRRRLPGLRVVLPGLGRAVPDEPLTRASISSFL